MVVSIVMKQKEHASVGYWVNYMTSTFDLSHDLDLDFSRLNFKITVCQDLLFWLIWNEKISNKLDTETLPLDHTHEFSMSKFEMALSQELEDRLT